MKQDFKDPQSCYPKANSANQYHPLTVYHLPCHPVMWLNRPVPYDCSQLIFSQLGQFQSIHVQQHKTPSQTELLFTPVSLSTAAALFLLFQLSRLPLQAPQLNQQNEVGRQSEQTHISMHIQIYHCWSFFTVMQNTDIPCALPNMIMAHHLNSIISDCYLTFSFGSIYFYALFLQKK